MTRDAINAERAHLRELDRKLLQLAWDACEADRLNDSKARREALTEFRRLMEAA